MIDPLDIQAFADGELTPEESARVEKEIAASEAATEHLMELRRLKECLRGKADTIGSEQAWRGALARLNEIDSARRAEGFVGKYAWALCALFFAVILAGGVLNRASGRSLKTGDVASYVASMGSVSSPAPHDPHMEFAQRYLNAVLSQSQSRTAMALEGERRGITPDGRLVVQYLFRDQQGIFSLLVVPGVTAVSTPDSMPETFSRGVVNQHNSVLWVQGDYGLVVIGDRPYEELQAIAEQIRITSPR